MTEKTIDLDQHRGMSPSDFEQRNIRVEQSLKKFLCMGWRIFQAAVIAAVLFSNIHWHWIPNGYLASIIGIFAAILATVVLTRIIDLWRRARPTLL